MDRALAAAGVLALTSILAGCLEGGSGSEAPFDETVREVARGQNSPLAGPSDRVITTQEAWDAFWRENRRNLLPGNSSEAPPVDFTKERVVVVILGERPNGCYGVDVTGARTIPADGVTNVTAKERTPRPGDFCTQALVNPFHAVAIPVRETRIEVDIVRSAPAMTGEPTVSKPVTFDVVARGTSSGFENETRRVISTDEEWAAFWTQHNARRSSEPDRPAINFTDERVLAVVLGDRPSGCYSVDVSRILDEGDHLAVDLAVTEPGKSSRCTDAITQPFVIVRVPAIAGGGTGDVTWRETTRSA